MTYLTNTGQTVRVHDHPSDQNCQWVNVLKPLALLALHDAQIVQHLVQSVHRKGKPFDPSDYAHYAKWLCDLGGNGLLNLANVLLLVCEVRGLPSLPCITPR